MRVFSLEQPGVAARRKSVLSIIVQSQQRAEAYAAHPAAQGPLLRVQPVGENALVSGQVERFIFIRVVCFLKYRYIIGAACMKICVFIRIHGIDLQPDYFKIFSRDPARFSDILHRGFPPAFSGEDQHLLQACLVDRGQLRFNLLKIELRAPYFVVRIESAVNTVIFTVIRDIDGCEHRNGGAEMLPRLAHRLLRDFFQKRQRRRRKQRAEILRLPVLFGEGAAHVFLRNTIRIILPGTSQDLRSDRGIENLHIWKISHVIRSFPVGIRKAFAVENSFLNK